MATLYSDDFTKVRAGRRMDPSVYGGRKQVITWDFASLPAGNLADVLVCGIIYKGQKVLGGREFHGALSSGGGTATGSYGTYLIAAGDGLTLGAADSAARFLAATSFEAAGQSELASTLALGALFVATVDVFLVCVNSGEAFATAGRVAGFLEVVQQ